MRYELIQEYTNGLKIYARIDDDGLCRATCLEDDPDYQSYLRFLESPIEDATEEEEIQPEVQ